MGDIFDSVDTVWGEKTEAFLVLGPMLAEAFAFIATTYHLCLNSRHSNFGWRRTTTAATIPNVVVLCEFKIATIGSEF